MKNTARVRGHLASKLQLKWRNVFLENAMPDASEVQPHPYTTGLELYLYQWLFRQLLFSTKNKIIKKNPTEVSHNGTEHTSPFSRLIVLGRLMTGHKIVATYRALIMT